MQRGPEGGRSLAKGSRARGRQGTARARCRPSPRWPVQGCRRNPGSTRGVPRSSWRLPEVGARVNVETALLSCQRSRFVEVSEPGIASILSRFHHVRAVIPTRTSAPAPARGKLGGSCGCCVSWVNLNHGFPFCYIYPNARNQPRPSARLLSAVRPTAPLVGASDQLDKQMQSPPLLEPVHFQWHNVCPPQREPHQVRFAPLRVQCPA